MASPYTAPIDTECLAAVGALVAAVAVAPATGAAP